MSLTPEQLENIVGFFLEHGPGRIGFVRVNLPEIAHLRIVVKRDGPDILISSYDDGCRVTDRFPVVKGMGS